MSLSRHQETIAFRALRKANMRMVDGFNVHEDIVSRNAAKAALRDEPLSDSEWRSLEDYSVKP